MTLEMKSETKTAGPSPSCSHAMRRALCLAVLLALPGGAQSVPHGTLPQPLGQAIGGSLADREDGNLNLSQREERARALNRQRQKNLVTDADKLLKLAGELDMEVKSDDQSEFTPQKLRKLAEIEKLAHSVKDKMSYSIKDPALFEPPPRFSAH